MKMMLYLKKKNNKNNKNNKENKEKKENNKDSKNSEESNDINLKNSNTLEEIYDINIENDSTIKLKDKKDIYLEIYKEALRKAKQIRSNAVEAFLQAKSIKNQYNLEDIINSDSSDSD